MKNLITIEPHKDVDGKDCLKVSLTIDGAKELDLNNSLDINHLYDNTPDKDGKKQLISVQAGEIFSQVFIPQDDELVKIKVYRTQQANIMEAWCKDHKAEFLYYPDKNNDMLMDEVKSKIATNHWAVYSDEKLSKVSINTGDRFAILAKVDEKLHEAMQILNYKAFNKTDDKYEDLIRSAAKEVEKEMDYLKEKMKIMSMVSKNDFNLDKTVAKLYMAHRGVKDKKPEKLGVKVQDLGKVFYFDYSPLGWKDMQIVQPTKEEALEAIKKAVTQNIINNQLTHRFDESQVIFIEDEQKAEASTPDSEGQNGSSIGQIGSDER